MSNQQPPRKPIKLTPFDVMSNWLYADPVAGAQKRPHFQLKILGNVPRFIVKTKVPDDRDYGKIEFNTDIYTFMVIIDAIRDLGEGKEEGSMMVEYNDHIFVNGQRSERPVTKATIKLGVDRETSRVYIAVLGHNRPKIQFFFGPSNFHAVKHGDGSDRDVAEISRRYARACASAWSKMAMGLIKDNFDEDAKNVAKPMGGPNQQGGGQRQGGGNNYGGQRQGGGGGGQAPAPAPAAAPDVGSFDDFGDDAW